MPPALAAVDVRGSPRSAVLVTGVVIGALVATGNVKTTWSFSAFTVLVYYAITNLAALRLPPEHRRYPRALAVLGLVSCLGLAFWVEAEIWFAGLLLIGVGLVWHAIARRVQVIFR
jgi:APA family basic amino acid/polyamine antiporter